MSAGGVRRTPEGARAMPDPRSVWVAGRWEAFQRHRVEHDRDRLYPRRDLVAREAFLARAPWRAGGYVQSAQPAPHTATTVVEEAS